MGLTWQTLFGSRRGAAEAARRKAAVPDGVVLYAIGDVHGQSLLLETLISQIQSDAEAHPGDKRILVFVGDYVDRGPSSRQVVERVSQGVPAFEIVGSECP